MKKAAARAILISCAAISALTWVLVAREGSAQRAPLLVVSERPIDEGLATHPRARVSELRIDDDGVFAFEGSTGRLSAAQLQQLRTELQHVRWVMARSTFLCDAIATQSHTVRSGNRRISWRSPCEPAPHASVLRIVARARAVVRAARSTTAARDAGAVIDAATAPSGDRSGRPSSPQEQRAQSVGL